MRYKNNKPTRSLIVIMILLVGIAIIVANFFYNKANNAVDPRIYTARELYKNYNMLAIENRFPEILDLLDSIENIYTNVPHYKNSYEIGVLLNNKTASYLTMALFKDTLKVSHDPFSGYSKDSLINLADESAREGIKIYETWLAKYDSISFDEITALIKDTFLLGMEEYSHDQQNIYVKARAKEIIEAQVENKRRLSVIYTNFGVIRRYFENYKEAAYCYTKALEYWDRNLTAENNLNKLLGRPLKKRNLLQKLFPPKRD